MSLIRQIWLLLLCTLLVGFGGSVAIYVVSTRALLETELRLKNSADASLLAQLLSQDRSEPAAMATTISAQFDTGAYRQIRYTPTTGAGVLLRESEPAPRHAPGWFARGIPIVSPPGSARVADGPRAIGSVEVVGRTDDAHDELWCGSLRFAVMLASLGVVAGGLAALGVRRIRAPLDATVRQAEALERGDYLTVALPQVPELQRLTRAMNSMVGRLRSVFEAQAIQVEGLRRQASCDPLTGLSNRGHFISRLGAALIREDASAAGGMVLLRVLRLTELNQSLGRGQVDRLLLAVGQTLQAYTAHVRGAFIGRLNGSDFALVLPESGMAVETAEAVVNLLRVELPILSTQVAVVAGAIEILAGREVTEWLAHADMALARAENAGPFSIMSAGERGSEAWARIGERGWHERLRQALDQGRVQLASFPLVASSGSLIHLECPLRLQLDPNGGYETAAQWLPLARRTRQTAAVDERGLALVTEAIARDGRARCISMSNASLQDSGFPARLQRRLEAAPQVADRVWIEVAEAAADEQPERMRELARRLRPTGARIGIKHTGDRLSRVEGLFDAGLDYVKLDAAITRGVAANPERASFVQGLVGMLHGLSLQVFGEGVVDEADAARLWECGIDGLAGPWFSMQLGGEAAD